MKTTRTPGPWSVYWAGGDAHPRKSCGVGPDGDGLVCFITHGNSGPVDSPEAIAEQDANAAFIVRACNSHDELVGALRGLNHVDEKGKRGGYCICPLADGSSPDERHATTCADARAALARAEEKSDA